MRFEQNRDRSDCTIVDRSIPTHRVTQETTREQLHLRNHDMKTGYDVRVRIQRADRCAFDHQLYLQPDGVRCLGELVKPDDWQVTVSLDGTVQQRAWCSIGHEMGHTAVIECGNGVVTVGQRG